MINKKKAQSLKKDLEFWTKKKPTSWIGKWGRKVRIDKLKEEIKNLKNAEIKTKEEPQKKGSKKKSNNKNSTELNAETDERGSTKTN